MPSTSGKYWKNKTKERYTIMTMEPREHHYPVTAEGLVEILRTLRSPDGCPWDRKQTYESLKSTLTEKPPNCPFRHRCQVRDVMMNLAFFAVIAENAGFHVHYATREIIAKMIRRHPMSSPRRPGDSDVSSKSGKRSKQELHPGTQIGSRRRPPNLSEPVQARTPEKSRNTALTGEPGANRRKIEEELQKSKRPDRGMPKSMTKSAICVRRGHLARFRNRGHRRIFTEDIRKFSHRFRYLERKLTEQFISLYHATTDQMEALWQEAKHISR